MSTWFRVRRLPEERASAETTNRAKVAWFWGEGGRLVQNRRDVQPRRYVQRLAKRDTEEEEAEEWIISSDDALPLITSSRPLPRRCPKFPQGGSRKEISEWNKACDRVYKLAANDPVTHPPLLRKTKDDFNTSSSDFYSASSRHRQQVILCLARSIVSISSTENDGLPEWNFNGIITGPSASDGRVRILTSSEAVCDYKGKLDHKLLVRLPNKVIKGGELVFFDHYYGLAILDICVDEPFLFEPPSFVSSSDYGDEVFVLTRKEDSSLMTTAGKVLCYNEPYFGRNHYLYLSCDLPERIAGALVMDQDGNVAGMTFDAASPKTAVLSSFIIKILIEMEGNFRCIARPVHDLSLRAVHLLNASTREEILYEHNIDGGFLVDEVEINSTAEMIGIRRGDVIVSVNGNFFWDMLELEEYLLSLGWIFLEKKTESLKIVLKLKVYDPLECEEHTLSLPLGFSTIVMDRVEVQEAEKAFVSASHDIKHVLRPRKRSEETSSEVTLSGRVLRPRKRIEKK